MSHDDVRNLQMRLKNCLQTILDLEPDIERLELGHVLLKEYGQLKSFLRKMDLVSLQENDVLRIEKATMSFLEELKMPLLLLGDDSPDGRITQ